MAFILDGKTLQIDVPFEHDGTGYPANWLRLSTPEQRADIGIIEIEDYPRPDDRFYWVSQNPDGTWNAIPKNLDDLKIFWISNTRQASYELLVSSDWLIIRKIEVGVEVPVEWTSYRSNVRKNAQDAILSLQNSSNIDEFILAVNSIFWPDPPLSVTATTN